MPVYPKGKDGAQDVGPGILADVAGLITRSLDSMLCGMVGAGVSIDALCSYLLLTRETLFSHLVRLDLQKPADTVSPRASVRSWSPEDIRRLIAWRPAGVHPEVIGQNLSRARSANAARAKARRLGIPIPARNTLFRPAAEQLTLPPPPPGHCSAAPLPHSCESPAPKASGACGQGILSLRPKPTPTEIAELDFADLTWIGQLPGRRGRPGAILDGITTNRAAVYAVGVVACAAVDRFEAAKILGLSEASYRTLRTRLGIPQVGNRTVFTKAFDREVGEETIGRAGIEIVPSIRRHDDRPPTFFWRFKDERQIRLAPNERARRARGEPTLFRPITVVTRDVLNAEARLNRLHVPPSAQGTLLHCGSPRAQVDGLQCPLAFERRAGLSAAALAGINVKATLTATLGGSGD